MEIEDVVYDELYITRHGSFCYLKNLQKTYIIFYLLYKQSATNYTTHVHSVDIREHRIINGVNINYWVRRIEL